MSCLPEPGIQSCDTGQQILFESCQLVIRWMSNTKLNTDSIRLGFLASESHPLT